MSETTSAASSDQERTEYIEAMLTAFEHDEPGIAEALALYDDAARHYAEAVDTTRYEVWTTSSSTSKSPD